jgi:hypothetical protein
MGQREKFLRKINEAFASFDTKFISKSVTDDIKWEIVGEKTISGRDAFEESLERMKLGGPLKIMISDIISSEDKAVVEGVVEMTVEPGKNKSYAFCDIYIFPGEENKKFKELRTYVSQIKKK